MTSFAAILDSHARRRPQKIAVVDGDRRLSYAALTAAVDQLVERLQASGVERGATVVSQLPNGIEAFAQCLAANRLGAVHNPILTTWGHRETEFANAAAGQRLPDTRQPPMFLLYTSGSTAEPKGVLHSDETLLTECETQARYHGLGDDEVFVMPSPVAHVSGLLYGILLPVLLGATAVLMRRWDPGEFLALVARERGTFCGGATPFLQGAVDHAEAGGPGLSSLRVFPCGGADVPPDLIRRALALGVRTGRGYGSTEFPSITSSAGPGEPEHRRAETDGRPIGANQVRIRGGEIQARGPELFLGYCDAVLDRAAFTDDGWFCTGDLGSIDADGYLTVTGRVKDVVIRSGEKISAREVEDLLHEHVKVAAAAIVALPDVRTGERACACVVPRSRDDPPTLAELAAFLHDRGLSTRKVPEHLEILDVLPVTASGKVNKHELRDQFGRAGRVSS